MTQAPAPESTRPAAATAPSAAVMALALALSLLLALAPSPARAQHGGNPSGPGVDYYFSLGPGENSYSHGGSSQAHRNSVRQEPDIQQGIALARERLNLMRDVAEYKWSRNLPIEDPERERQLLSRLIRKGLAMGLDPRITQAYFADQISAAKQLQRTLFAQWKKHRYPRFNAPDLAAQRARIDDVTNRMLHNLVKLRNISLRPGGSGALRTAALAELRRTGAGARDPLTLALRPLLQGLPVERYKSLRPGAPPVAP